MSRDKKNWVESWFSYLAAVWPFANHLTSLGFISLIYKIWMLILPRGIVSDNITCLKYPQDPQRVQGQYPVNISSSSLSWITNRKPHRLMADSQAA